MAEHADKPWQRLREVMDESPSETQVNQCGHTSERRSNDKVVMGEIQCLKRRSVRQTEPTGGRYNKSLISVCNGKPALAADLFPSI